MMARPKKILFLITKANWGGAQRYVCDLATNLSSDRFETVVAGGGTGILFAKLRDADIRAISVTGLQRDVAIASEWRAFLHIFRLLKKERPDVIHLNSSKAAALGTAAAWILKLLCFLPTWKRGFQVLGNPVSKYRPLIIFTAHGWGFHEDRSALARAAIFFVSWFSSLFQDKIIVLDTADLAAAEKFIPRRKLAFIPNGIGGIDFYARPDMSGRAAARAFLSQKISRPIADGALLIGAIAELTKNKGLRHLIDALHLIEHRTSRITHDNTTPLIRANKGVIKKMPILYIIGEGEEKETLQKQIDALRLHDSIFLVGFIPDANRYLKAFDIFVLPSLKEGVPYAAMEAMSAGLAVVATRVGGMPDLITDGENGVLVEAKNPRAIADAIEGLIWDPEMGASRVLGARAKNAIRTKFSFSDMMERTITLYEARQ